jgi:hypothetical protein
MGFLILWCSPCAWVKMPGVHFLDWIRHTCPFVYSERYVVHEIEDAGEPGHDGQDDHVTVHATGFLSPTSSGRP